VCLHNTNDAIGLGFKVGRANLVISIGEPFEVEEVAEAVEKARVWIQSELTKGLCFFLSSLSSQIYHGVPVPRFRTSCEVKRAKVTHCFVYCPPCEGFSFLEKKG